ncbi:MAG: GNAT family N-acetyltransferase [Candidatus Micrarchaeota archaeon]|nr:GNAT family N-acetyltransferase [Candidatus Micrarchaeota archaeon]
MTQTFKVRRAMVSDTKQIAGLMRHRDIFRLLGKDYTVANLRSWLADNEELCLVAESEERIVGLALSYPFGFGGGYFDHIRLFDLAVDPRYRNHGVARRICFSLFSSLKKSGIKKVMAFVESDNKAVQEFNRTIGMAKEGMIKGLFMDGKRPVSGVVYGRSLA